jgi:hypothetical protein
MLKKILIGAGILFFIGAGIVWYLFTDTHKDTATIAAAYTLQATDFIKEFETNLPAANKKYTEKIIGITGKLTEKQSTDSSLNLIITDTTKGSYINFSFQQKDMAAANATKIGEKISIKGSCSGGEFSEILETHYINFNRCTLIK